MKFPTQTRRSFLACAPLLGALVPRLLANDYLRPQTLSDGSTLYSGYKYGYPVQAIIRVHDDGPAVERFEVTVTARHSATIQSLLQSAGLEPIGQTEFPSNQGTNGRYLLVGLGDVTADYNITINGQLFLDAGAGEKLVNSGQKVEIIAGPGAKLAARK